MAKVTSDMSMSLDGFIAGPHAGRELPLGEGGERLHEWVFGLASWRARHGLSGGQENRDAEVFEESFANLGATVMGRRMFDTGEEPWGDNPPFHMPVFVLTHKARDTEVKQGGTTFTFVTDGVESAIKQAKAAADGKDVAVAGGANAVTQAIAAGLVDEIQIHLAHVLLGDGIPLSDNSGGQRIELERTRVIESPGVTHIRFRVLE